MTAMPNLHPAETLQPDLPMLRPSLGPPLAGIRGFYRDAGCDAYDPA